MGVTCDHHVTFGTTFGTASNQLRISMFQGVRLMGDSTGVNYGLFRLTNDTGRDGAGEGRGKGEREEPLSLSPYTIITIGLLHDHW